MKVSLCIYRYSMWHAFNVIFLEFAVMNTVVSACGVLLTAMFNAVLAKRFLVTFVAYLVPSLPHPTTDAVPENSSHHFLCAQILPDSLWLARDF